MLEYIETKIREKFGEVEIILEQGNIALSFFGLSNSLQLIDKGRLGRRGFYVTNSISKGIEFNEFTRGTDDDNCFVFPYANRNDNEIEDLIISIYEEVESRGYDKNKLRFYLLHNLINGIYNNVSIVVTEQDF